MMQNLIWIAVCYGLSIVVVHCCLKRVKREATRHQHYILLTKDNQSNIEWTLRSLFFLAWVNGEEYKITILDESSEDDTMAIITRLSKGRNMDIEQNLDAEGASLLLDRIADDESVVMRLDRQDYHNGAVLQ